MRSLYLKEMRADDANQQGLPPSSARPPAPSPA